jgi:hypothetical protein
VHDRRPEGATDDVEQPFTAVGKGKQLRDVARRRYRTATRGGNRLRARRRAELVRCNQNVCDFSTPYFVVQRYFADGLGDPRLEAPGSVGRSRVRGATPSEARE